MNAEERARRIDLVRTAIEAADDCCHAGSPRGISVVYDYIPTITAAEIAVDTLAALEDPE